MRHLLPALILSLLLATPARADLVVVVARTSPIETLDERQIADIFLAKTNRLQDGKHVRPLELRDPALRESFYRAIAGKTLAQINSYWTTLIFTGKGRPPKTLGEEDSLVDALERDPYAISYVLQRDVTHAMKTVYVLR